MKKIKGRILSALLSTFLILGSGFPKPPAFAEDQQPVARMPAMTIQQLEEALRSNNPQLIQARKNYDSARAVSPQLLAPNNPQIGFVNDPVPANPLNLGASQSFYYTLTESFPFPGKKKIPARIADDQAESIKSQADALYLQLSAQLKTDFYQLLLFQRQREINRETIARLTQMKEISRVRYAENAAAYVDYLNAQVAKSSAENDQFALEREIASVRATINTLVGRDPANPLEISGELNPSVSLPKKSMDELEVEALDHNPNIKGSFLQVEAAKKGVDLAKLNYYPDFNVILYFNSSNPPIDVAAVNSYGTEFDITFPLYFFGKEKSGVEQAQAALEASQAGDQSMRQQIRLAVDTAYNTLAQAVNQVNFIKGSEIVEAKTAYRLALSNYGSGNASFLDLLTAQNNLRAVEILLAQSESNSIQAFANLVQAVGTDIE